MKEGKNISLSISNECWKKLKIISIQKDIALSEYIKDVLEKHSIKSKINNEVLESI